MVNKLVVALMLFSNIEASKDFSRSLSTPIIQKLSKVEQVVVKYEDIFTPEIIDDGFWGKDKHGKPVFIFVSNPKESLPRATVNPIKLYPLNEVLFFRPVLDDEFIFSPHASRNNGHASLFLMAERARMLEHSANSIQSSIEQEMEVLRIEDEYKSQEKK